MKKLMIVLALTSTSVTASQLEGDVNLPKWEFGVGLSAASINEYIGSKEKNNFALPFPYFIYRGDRLTVDRKLLRAKLFDDENTEAGLSFGGAAPAESRDDGLRAGMPDIDPAIEVGLAFERRFYYNKDEQLNFNYELPVRAVFATDFKEISHKGYIATPRLKLVKNIAANGGQHKISASIGPVFASRKYHDYYYGVDAQFATADREAFDGESGYSGTRITLGHAFSRKNWWVGTFTRYWNSTGSKFSDSSLVDTEHSFAVGFAIGWVIKRKFADDN